MKNLIIIILSLLIIGFANGQPCSDLIISEIVFGKHGSSEDPNTLFENYSVELYNPTDNPIDLENYKVELISGDNTSTEIEFSGIIGAKEPFVLSFTNSSTGVKALSDLIVQTLDFEEKIILQLTNNNVPIDVVGKAGLGVDVDQIELNKLLNDPTYLTGLNVDLRSIENLTFRRRVGVQEGKTGFIESEILKDWEIYPHYMIDYLGEHLNVCTPNTIEVRWRDVINQGTSFVEDQEANLTWSAQNGQYIKGIIELNGTVNNYITMYAAPVPEPPLGSDQATQGFNEDFEVPSLTNPFNEFEIPAFISSDIPVEVCEVFDDNIVENHETATFRLEYGNTGNQTVFIGFPEVFWVGIIDDDGTSTIDLDIQNKVTLFPTVSDDIIKLSSAAPNLKFEGVYTFSVEGKHENYVSANNTDELAIDINNYPNGYHVLIIYTSAGVITKRFIKF